MPAREAVCALKGTPSRSSRQHHELCARMPLVSGPGLDRTDGRELLALGRHSAGLHVTPYR